jgi:FkbM family methyltransferase
MDVWESSGPIRQVSEKLANRGFSMRTLPRALRRSRLRVLGRLAWWTLHCLLGIPATITVGQAGARLRLPPRLRRGGGSTGIYVLREDYEPEFAFFQSQLSQGMVVIDGGANLGIYTVVASKLVGENGKVLSFEPGAIPFQELQANVALNNATNVSTFQAALSDHSGSARLYQSPAGLVAAHLAFHGDSDAAADEYEEVPVRTLDEVLNSEGIDKVDMLKLDVEGVEELALRGARSLFSRSKPLVICEMWVKESGQRVGPWRFLSDLGYRFYEIDPDGELRPSDSPRHGNNVALPPRA